MEYTINKGDCMWNIVKAQYGDKVKSNADILKAVNKLAEINNIADPNLIYTGNTLNIPSYESIFGPEAVASDLPDDASLEPANEDEEKAASASLYEDFSNWIKDSYDKLMNGKRDELEMYDYVDTDISHEDAAFKEPLLEGANNIAASNLAAADTDQDGAMSYDEYLHQEASQYNELFPNDAYKFDDETGKLMTQDFETGEYKIDDYTNQFMQENFSALDLDKSGSLEQDELSAYYLAMDASDSTKGYVDGKIQIGAMINTDLTGDDFQTRYTNAADLFGADTSV